MKVPIISVIMSTYNEEENYLREAIESVLTQTYSDFEFLIVLDNPSNAMIRMVVQQYANQDERIRVLPNDKNMGLTHSLNRALRCVRGQFVSRMDADDRMGQNCLKRELEMIVAEELDLVSASKINMDEQGKLKGKYINSVSPEQMKWLLPYDNMVNHPTVLVRTKSILREGGYRNIISCEDYDLWIRMLCHGCRMKVIPEVLLFYRRREDGICESNSYQLYLSKKFVKKLYQKYKQDHESILSMQNYQEYLQKQNLSLSRQQRFNQAYQLLYIAFDYRSRKQNKLFYRTLGKAILRDWIILRIVLDKIQYQIRKSIVLKFC